MGMYKQLTQYHCYHIRIYLKAGYWLSGIARRLGVHKSTVSREIRRNRGHKGLSPSPDTRKRPGTSLFCRQVYKMTPVMIELIGYYIANGEWGSRHANYLIIYKKSSGKAIFCF